MDCFNYNCPFRVNEISNIYNCDCIACQQRDANQILIQSNKTLTNDEINQIIKRQELSKMRERYE